jgi:signal transduction histidine kinase
MMVSAAQVRSEQHAEVGAVIRRDAALILERWCKRVVADRPDDARAHHAALLDHLPALLDQIGHFLGEVSDANACPHARPARRHGDQRWEAGWSLSEVVHDYQTLRLVLVGYLEEALGRPLGSREVMALGLALDESINASVAAYVKHREEALRRQAEALEVADRRKDEFLATLAHELRNPLAPMQNALQVLVLRDDDAATREWGRGVLERQVRQMTGLVDDLFDLSRIARGKVTLRRERLDLARLVQSAGEDRLPAFAEQGLTLDLAVPAEPVWVEGDPTRLGQVVGNLLTNAGKFTEEGGKVVLRVEREPGRARVSVRDTGVGIAPELLGHVFEMFRQGREHTERGRGGLGLGLALVKGLVELHGGEVRAASEGLGRGAEISLWLPLAEAPPSLEAAPPEPPATRRLRVLVVEDEPDSAESMRLVLELGGHEVTVARTGAEALEAARAGKPDVVFCDLGLPDMTGYDVAAALRANPETAGARLVALSGRGARADRRAA